MGVSEMSHCRRSNAHVLYTVSTMAAEHGSAATVATTATQAAGRPSRNDKGSVECKHHEADWSIMFGFANSEVEDAELLMHWITSCLRKEPATVRKGRDLSGCVRTARPRDERVRSAACIRRAQNNSRSDSRQKLTSCT